MIEKPFMSIEHDLFKTRRGRRLAKTAGAILLFLSGASYGYAVFCGSLYVRHGHPERRQQLHKNELNTPALMVFSKVY